MANFVRKGRLRRVVSAICAFAMVFSVAAPAFAWTGWPATVPSEIGSYNAGGTNLTLYSGNGVPGLNGNFQMEVTGGLGRQAKQVSLTTYADSSTVVPVASLLPAVTSASGDKMLRVGIYSPTAASEFYRKAAPYDALGDYDATGDYPAGYLVDVGSTYPAAGDPIEAGVLLFDVPSVTPTNTVVDVVANINATFAALDFTSATYNPYQVAGQEVDKAAYAEQMRRHFNMKASLERSAGGWSIVLKKVFAEDDAQIWAYDLSDRDVTNSGGVADILWGGKSGWADDADWGRGSAGSTTTWLPGQGADAYNDSYTATFTPTLGRPYRVYMDFGSWTDAAMGTFDSGVDYDTGLLTAVRLDSDTWRDDPDYSVNNDDTFLNHFLPLPWTVDTATRTWDQTTASTIILGTADDGTSIANGTVTFALASGTRQPNYGRGNDGADESVWPRSIVSGKSATFTVEVPIGYEVYDDAYNGSDPEGYENAINGVKVLFPKGFAFDKNPTTNANPSVFTDGNPFTVASTDLGVETTVTAYGPMVTYTKIFEEGVHDGDVFDVAAYLKAPTKAGRYDGVKVWIRNVGTASDKWIPVFCDLDPAGAESATYDDESYPQGIKSGEDSDIAGMALRVEPDAVKTMTTNTPGRNRAGGFTALTVGFEDQYANVIEPGDPGYPADTQVALTLADRLNGAAIESVGGGAYKWKLSKVPAINAATVTAVGGTLTKTVTVDSIGIGEPAKVTVEIATPATQPAANGSVPSFYLQLRDAQNNPTSFADPTVDPMNYRQDYFQTNLVSPEVMDNTRNYIDQGWTRTTSSDWPSTFIFGAAAGPDVWTLNASSLNGLVESSPFTHLTIAAPLAGVVGVPYDVKVTAAAAPPADYAVGDDVYGQGLEDGNGHDISRDQFGVAKADGSDAVTLTAQVIDENGDAVTSAAAAGLSVQFNIPQGVGVRGVLPTGHTYKAVTDATGKATVRVTSTRGSVLYDYHENNDVADFPHIDTTQDQDYDRYEAWSWFTPVKASVTIPARTQDPFFFPCDDPNYANDFGYVYFHAPVASGTMEKTAEGYNKWIALADGQETFKFTGKVTDQAFPSVTLPGVDLKFVTTVGSLDASGAVKSIETSSGADGTYTVEVRSATAGYGMVLVYDRQAAWDQWDRDPSLTDGNWASMIFTDYATKYEVDATPVSPAGDRATKTARVWWENIKTGARVSWDGDFSANPTESWLDDNGPSSIDRPDWPNLPSGYWNWGACVYGYRTIAGVETPSHANDIGVDNDVDTNADGKMDAVDIAIPAYDADGYEADNGGDGWLESAGKRYALVDGPVSAPMWVGSTFYNDLTFWAAPARIPAEFKNSSTVAAEGNQLDTAISLVGENFLPGLSAPDHTDAVALRLGDITTGSSTVMGEAYVGRDGQLLPTAVLDANLKTLSPGTYDITVDGLVFKNGLTIQNLFKKAWISINYKNDDVVYVKGNVKVPVNVNAFGSRSAEVWAGSLKLAATDTENQSGLFTMDTSRITAGLHNMTARISWPTIGGLADTFFNTLVTRKFYVQKSLTFSSTKMTHSGRKLTVSGKASGPAEASGSKNFKVIVTIQKLKNGHWTYYTHKHVTSTAGSYKLTYSVKSAGKYRAKVSHSDSAHPFSAKYTSSHTIK